MPLPLALVPSVNRSSQGEAGRAESVATTTGTSASPFYRSYLGCGYRARKLSSCSDFGNGELRVHEGSASSGDALSGDNGHCFQICNDCLCALLASEE